MYSLSLLVHIPIITMFLKTEKTVLDLKAYLHIVSITLVKYQSTRYKTPRYFYTYSRLNDYSRLKSRIIKSMIFEFSGVDTTFF